MFLLLFLYPVMVIASSLYENSVKERAGWRKKWHSIKVFKKYPQDVGVSFSNDWFKFHSEILTLFVTTTVDIFKFLPFNIMYTLYNQKVYMRLTHFFFSRRQKTVMHENPEDLSPTNVKEGKDSLKYRIVTFKLE